MIYSKKTIQSLKKHTSLLPPVIINGLTGRVAVFTNGGPTVKIDDTVTLEDIRSRWIRMPDKEVTDELGKWTVQGSKGNQYTVILNYGKYECTCRGYQFYKNCKHIKNIKK